LIAFGRPKQQNEKWDDEMEGNDKQTDGFPGAFPAVEVPDCFFRNVGIPDQKILSAGNVSPENDEGEQQPAQIVELFSGDYIG